MSREIDALVAEHVMGYEVHGKTTIPFKPFRSIQGGGGGRVERIEDYSTSIEAAWVVVEKTDLLSWDFCLARIAPNNHWAIMAAYDKDSEGCDGTIIAEAKTAPMAICLAALRSKNVKVDDV